MINTVVPFERPFLTHKIRIIYRFYMKIKHIRLSTKYMFLTIFGEDFWTKRMEGYQNEIKYLVVVLTQHPTKQEYRILNLSRDTELDWTCLRCFCGIFFHLFCVCVCCDVVVFIHFEQWPEKDAKGLTTTTIFWQRHRNDALSNTAANKRHGKRQRAMVKRLASHDRKRQLKT